MMGDPEPTSEAPAPPAAAAAPIELTIPERVAELAQELIEHGVTPHWRQALEELWGLVVRRSGGGAP